MKISVNLTLVVGKINMWVTPYNYYRPFSVSSLWRRSS